VHSNLPASFLVAIVLAATAPALSAALGQGAPPVARAESAQRGSQSPVLATHRIDELARTKARLQAGDSVLQPAYDRLLKQADTALQAGPFSVMQKKRVPPSGDRHDYVSMGPYWWPDPSKPNGLPYIRKDGQRNPETQNDYDSPRFKRLTDAANALSLAYYFTRKDVYAQRAAYLLRTWFLDSATRMNPNLNYGQEIPGIVEGRGIGIIDTRAMAQLLDDVALLQRAPSWTKRDADGLREWMSSYLGWLLTSKNGHEEHDAKNNHGSWYDAQTVAVALFVGRRDLARAIVDSSRARRIATQIERSGRQPLEEDRTRSLDYSIFNLEALMQVAELGRIVGVDVWGYEAPSGGSIHKALDYLATYADTSKKWSGEQITPIDPARMLLVLRLGERVYHDPKYTGLIANMPAASVRPNRLQLEYPPR
jgi:hypothetical protein